MLMLVAFGYQLDRDALGVTPLVPSVSTAAQQWLLLLQQQTVCSLWVARHHQHRRCYIACSEQ